MEHSGISVHSLLCLDSQKPLLFLLRIIPFKAEWYAVRGNAILASIYPWEWRSRSSSLIDFLLPKKERKQKMELCGKSLVFAQMSFASVQNSKAFISPTSMLGPILCALLVSGSQSNIPLDVQRNLLYFFFFVISVLAWALLMLLQLSISCSDNESLSLHLAISCFLFSTAMIQQKEFIKGVKCLVIIRGGKTNLAIFDHRGLSQQPLKSALSSFTVLIKNHPYFLPLTSLWQHRVTVICVV